MFANGRVWILWGVFFGADGTGNALRSDAVKSVSFLLVIGYASGLGLRIVLRPCGTTLAWLIPNSPPLQLNSMHRILFTQFLFTTYVVNIVREMGHALATCII